jgi:hypothetical protein
MKSRLGEKYVTNENLEVEIIEYINATNCTVKFKDGFILKNKYYYDVVNGKLKNPFYTSVYNVGYIGVGKYKTKEKNIRNKNYLVWADMIRRCYDVKLQEKRSSYKNCLVHKEWHNFQNFAKWIEENYIEGYSLDKDIFLKGNRVYSSDTCCFVPNVINSLFASTIKKNRTLPLGVVKHKLGFRAQITLNGKTTYLGVSNNIEDTFSFYKEAKENYIKKTAIDYYSRGKIGLKLYNTLYNYKVEITD